jgi:ABC-type lipopolysaccharide export system ATPase subunit
LVAILFLGAGTIYIENEQLQAEFLNYLAKQGKSYLTEEKHAFRFSKFAKTNDLIEVWNATSRILTK